jgi:predicted ATP-grasp superfamily ATP-dependent carboligase
VRQSTPVLVTDAPSNASLAVVRSLGRRGVPVGVGTFAGEFNLAGYSRWAAESCPLPSPSQEPAAFIEALAALLEGGKYPIVFPTTDRTIQLVSEARHRLPTWVQIPIADAHALGTVLDKARTGALAAQVGVPIPRTWCPATEDEVEALAAALTYPVIVKPRKTNFLGTNGRLVKVNYRVVQEPADLPPAWRAVHEAVPLPVVQAMVRGRGVGINTLWRDGQPLAWFCHKRVRELDLQGGRSTAAISAPCEPRLLDSAQRLLGALRWHGVAMVEFKWDETTGDYWLLEVNGRFWGSLPLALAAGMDFPYYLYQLAVGETPAAPAAYREGVLARDAVGELKHFVKVMAAGKGARLATLGQSPTILHPWKASFNWVDDDPEPGRREWLRTLGRAFGRRAFRRRRAA